MRVDFEAVDDLPNHFLIGSFLIRNFASFRCPRSCAPKTSGLRLSLCVDFTPLPRLASLVPLLSDASRMPFFHRLRGCFTLCMPSPVAFGCCHGDSPSLIAFTYLYEQKNGILSKVNLGLDEW